MSEVSSTTRRLTYGTWRHQRSWTPREIVDAEGCYFTDSSGNRYLDFSSQLVCSNLGHKNAVVINAICEQARRLPYILPTFATRPRSELSIELTKIMPTGLEKFFFATSGTEANEAAMKIARLYTGKSKIISRYRSYHGSTAASISVSGDPRRIPTEPTGKMPGGLFGPDAYCYRCPFGLEYPECDIACAEYLDYMIKHESDIAAVIVEPIVGSNGVIVPPDEYLPRIREITENYGVLLICDEVMTAWGRTGKWFAVDHWKLNPDIITTAKGITGAYVPLSVTATTKEIADHFEDNYFAHGHTYEAHPLTLAAGVAAISEYRRLNLVERSEKVGKALGNKLKAVQDRHPSVGDVRGIGMFWGIELVQDRKSKHATNTVEEKLNGKPLIVDLVASDCMRQGVFVMTGFTNCLIIAPPLVVEEKDLDKGITALDQSLRIADEAVEHGQ